MATTQKPYGIVLPIARGDQGYFAQSFNVADQIKTNLNLLLRTKRGERRMNPNFGSGLWNILFEQTTDNLSVIIEDVIRKDISRWMQYINVSSVEIDNTSDPTKHLLNVKVIYTIPSVGITNEQTLEVSMNTTRV
jgi:phage baseplate assembly protein W